MATQRLTQGKLNGDHKPYLSPSLLTTAYRSTVLCAQMETQEAAESAFEACYLTFKQCQHIHVSPAKRVTIHTR